MTENDNWRAHLRSFAVFALIVLVLINFLIPVMYPSTSLPEGLSVELGEPSAYHDIVDGYIRWPGQLFGSSVSVLAVISPGDTLLWEDVEIKIVSDDGEVLVSGLRPMPLGTSSIVGGTEGVDDVLAWYENDIIMHGHVYPGDTLYLSNLTGEYDDARVKLLIDGELLASFKLDLPLFIQFCGNDWYGSYITQ